MAKTLKDFVAAARAGIEEIDCADLRDLLDSGDDLLLVDVREPGEYASGRLRGAISVPRGVLEGAADTDFPKRNEALCAAREREVVVYCATGGRSAMAADVLQQMGFGRVKSLAGGMTAWNDNGFETVVDPD